LHSFFSASSPFTIIGWFDDLPINDEHHFQNGIGDCLTIVKVVDDTFESEGRKLVDKRREDAPWDCIQSGRGDDIVEAAVLVLTARETGGDFAVFPENRASTAAGS
jgi:hypothetical protein